MRAQNLLLRYQQLHTARDNHMREIEKIRKRSLGNTISPSQQTALLLEMETIKGKCNLGYRTGLLKEGKDDVPADMFSNLASSIVDDCPMINDILKTLIGTKEKNVKNKTNEYKMRSSGHALSGFVTKVCQ